MMFSVQAAVHTPLVVAHDHHMLPQEITDAIIDSCAGDLGTLAKLCLVSQSFERSRQLIYSHLNIATESSKHSILPEKLVAIIDASPHIASFVRSLDIQVYGYPVDDWPKPKWNPKTPWSSLHFIFSHLLWVERLSITNSATDEDCWMNLVPLVRKWPLLTRMKLWNPVPLSPRGMSSLRSLSIHSSYYQKLLSETMPDRNSSDLLPAQLDELDLEEDMLGDNEDIDQPTGFFGPDSPVDISRLRVFFFDARAISGRPQSLVSQIIQRISPTVEILDISLDKVQLLPRYSPVPICLPPSLPRLHTLKFHLPFGDFFYDPTNTQLAIDYIALSLSAQATNTNKTFLHSHNAGTNVLTNILITLTFDRTIREIPAITLSWLSLDLALTEISAFAHLTDVHIKLAPLGGYAPLPPNLATTFLERDFPGMQTLKKGLVRMEVLPMIKDRPK